MLLQAALLIALLLSLACAPPAHPHLHLQLPHSGVIALAGTLGYILSFAIGAGPVTGLIVPEINKEAVRGGLGLVPVCWLVGWLWRHMNSARGLHS